jgi:hypothetical protein
MACRGLENRWAYRFPLKSQWFGLPDKQRVAVVQSADLLINVSGTLEHPEDYRRIPRSLYIDTDPVVTQIKLAIDIDGFRQRVDSHDVHFSFGESLSQTVPTTGHNWISTRQPIVLSEWRDSAPPQRDVFTTVMNWTSYKPLVYSGRTYGQKDVEFQRFLNLPRKIAPVAIEVAFSRTEHLEWQTRDESPPVELTKVACGPKWTRRNLLVQNGWNVVDAIQACGDLDTYRHFIQSSKAEWSVAKNAYVIGQPGWFSERSACYLAAGRPVIVQDTGFSEVLPVGDGILSFNTLEEAEAAIRKVEENYCRHSEAARSIAETYFDSNKVLCRLLDIAMSSCDHAKRDGDGRERI